MNILDDVAKICGVKSLSGEFSFSSVGGKSFVFEGKYKIIKFSNTEITLKLNHKKYLVVSGEEFLLGTMSPSELGLSGTVKEIRLLDEIDNKGENYEKG